MSFPILGALWLGAGITLVMVLARLRRKKPNR
jgi:hypothetical protein